MLAIDQTSLRVIHQPPSGKGRQRIYGTVLQSAEDEFCLVRRINDFAEDAGGTGSRRVAIWLALRKSDMGPEVVRREWPDGWRVALDYANPVWFGRNACVLRRCGFGPPRTTWPTSVWDRRVILPDNDRWTGGPVDEEMVRRFLADRNTCPDDEVWRIDALILAYAGHDRDG